MVTNLFNNGPYRVPQESELKCVQSDGWLMESEIEISIKVRTGLYHEMQSGGEIKGRCMSICCEQTQVQYNCMQMYQRVSIYARAADKRIEPVC